MLLHTLCYSINCLFSECFVYIFPSLVRSKAIKRDNNEYIMLLHTLFVLWVFCLHVSEFSKVKGNKKDNNEYQVLFNFCVVLALLLIKHQQEERQHSEYSISCSVRTCIPWLTSDTSDVNIEHLILRFLGCYSINEYATLRCKAWAQVDV